MHLTLLEFYPANTAAFSIALIELPCCLFHSRLAASPWADSICAVMLYLHTNTSAPMHFVHFEVKLPPCWCTGFSRECPAPPLLTQWAAGLHLAVFLPAVDFTRVEHTWLCCPEWWRAQSQSKFPRVAPHIAHGYHIIHGPAGIVLHYVRQWQGHLGQCLGLGLKKPLYPLDMGCNVHQHLTHLHKVAHFSRVLASSSMSRPAVQHVRTVGVGGLAEALGPNSSRLIPRVLASAARIGRGAPPHPPPPPSPVWNLMSFTVCRGCQCT